MLLRAGQTTAASRSVRSNSGRCVVVRLTRCLTRPASSPPGPPPRRMAGGRLDAAAAPSVIGALSDLARVGLGSSNRDGCHTACESRRAPQRSRTRRRRSPLAAPEPCSVLDPTPQRPAGRRGFRSALQLALAARQNLHAPEANPDLWVIAKTDEAGRHSPVAAAPAARRARRFEGIGTHRCQRHGPSLSPVQRAIAGTLDHELR